MNYFIIGNEDTVLGFELAGVSGIAVETPEEADKALTEALSDKNNAVLIITKSSADMIREKVDKLLFSSSFPLIVEIPGSCDKNNNSKDLRTLVNEAIGIKL